MLKVYMETDGRDIAVYRSALLARPDLYGEDSPNGLGKLIRHLITEKRHPKGHAEKVSI
jgi:hypothetical protein